MATKRRGIKKKWRPVYSDKPLDNYFIGELYTAAPSDMVGRYILINLSSVTNNLNHQHFNIKFKVAKIEGDRGIAEVIGYFMQQAYEKRLVRRKKEKIVDAFGVKTKDNRLIVVKPLIITNSKCPKAVQTKIRKYTRHFFAVQASKLNSEEIFDKIINHEFQSTLRKELSKITPIAYFEMRKIYKADKFSLLISPETYKDFVEGLKKQSKKEK